MMRRFLTIAAALSILGSVAHAETANLLFDPGMEEGGWDTVIIGNPADIAPDTDVKHGGSQSMRIVAKDTTRSYVRSKSIPVAPGERIKAGAWVKFKDVPEGKGTIIAIAEWTGADGKGSDVAKFDVATRNGTESDWQYVAGTVEVPAGAANVRVRLGFSYLQGTVWWDDASLTAESATALRIDLPSRRVTPAMVGLPVTIINRERIKDAGTIKITAGKESAEVPVSVASAAAPLTVPLPLGKQKGKVVITATLTASGHKLGEARFDGVIPAPLVLPPVSPTHWCVEDGPAKIGGDIDLSVAPAEAASGATMSATLLDAKGKVVATQHWSGSALVTGKPTPLALTTPAALKEGDYKVVVEFTGKGGEKLTAEQPLGVIPRRLAKVTLSRGGFPVYDGKEIFPLGIFNGGRFEEQGKAGFNVSHAYNAVRITPGRDPEDQRAKNFLDESYKHGQKAVFMVPHRLAGEGDWENFRKRIRLFKNHPGLLMWDEEEELVRGDWTADIRAKVYKIVHEEDPNHPFMQGDSRDVITKMGDRSNFFDTATMDLGMWWWYPFPLTPAGREANALEGEEASKGLTLDPPNFLVKRNTTKPIWVGIQAYNKKVGTSRWPTPAEYRLQAYYGIVAGAQGLMWYGGGVTGGMHTNVKESHWDAVQEVAKELHDLEWAWLGETTQHWETIGTIPVAGIVKKAKQGTVVVVTNRGEKPADVSLPTQGLNGNAEVFGKGKSVTFANGMKVSLEPYGVRVYVLTK